MQIHVYIVVQCVGYFYCRRNIHHANKNIRIINISAIQLWRIKLVTIFDYCTSHAVWHDKSSLYIKLQQELIAMLIKLFDVITLGTEWKGESLVCVTSRICTTPKRISVLRWHNNGKFAPEILCSSEMGDYDKACIISKTRPLFTKRQDVSPPKPGKHRSRAIGCYNNSIALKFDRHRGSSATKGPVKFQSDWKKLNPSLHEISRGDFRPLS